MGIFRLGDRIECDRDLRTPTKKPGFYRMCGLQRSFIVKTRFLTTSLEFDKIKVMNQDTP
ncbi:hypothetical protein QUA82_08005 [Microcoleus sp. F8-D3]